MFCHTSGNDAGPDIPQQQGGSGHLQGQRRGGRHVQRAPRHPAVQAEEGAGFEVPRIRQEGIRFVS